MLTLYTAVGTLKFQKTTGGKSIPLVINDGQEYGLSDDELLLWSCLAFQILTLHELQDAYTLRQIQKEGPKGLSFQHYLNRLSLRGLVVSGIGLTGVDALYRLLGSLTIIPLKDTFPIRLFGCVQLYLEGTIGAKEFGRYLKKKRHSLFLCLNAGKGGLRKQMIPELARHKRKETLCQSKELRIL